MCRRRQPDNQQARFGVAESREWLGPILHAEITPRRVPRRGFAPPDQARAAPAINYRTLQFLEGYHTLTVTIAENTTEA
jgi:hypothetical protein